MIFFRNVIDKERIKSTIYGMICINSMSFLCVILFFLIVIPLSEIFGIYLIGDIPDISEVSNLLLFTIFLIVIVVLSALFCSRTKEAFGALDCYNFFGLFSEVHLNRKSVNSKKNALSY
ncbi:hypothetical protein VZ95_19690 [Elstera litoralis]|uniref:Uncharacterized protein n=1 Tax=Elstera litoralis TaxID=552518 RepID=A0A0F3IMX1_9PROT|nr:hypothetical protein VZ95_19690 [Elstera litoralis]